MAIPLSLAFFVTRRRNIPFSFVFWLFVAFILSCGITHLIDAIMFYEPVYRFLGLMKAITAVVSITTAIVLIRVMPAALKIPEISTANRRLREEAATREVIQQELEAARTALEGRTGELTLQSHRIESAMESTWVIASQWVAETGEIVWEIGSRRWLRELKQSSGQPAVTSWRDILGEQRALDLIAESRAAVDEAREIDFSCSIEAHDGTQLQVRVAGTPDRRVAGASSTITGMARLI